MNVDYNETSKEVEKKEFLAEKLYENHWDFDPGSPNSSDGLRR